MDDMPKLCTCAACRQTFDLRLTEGYEDRQGNRLCSWTCWEDWMRQPRLQLRTVNGEVVTL